VIRLQKQNLHLIVGPHCSEGLGKNSRKLYFFQKSSGMIPVAQLAVKYNVPVIGYESVAADMLTLRSTKYATLSRVGQYGSQLGELVLLFF
jgi:hypothetical protein